MVDGEEGAPGGGGRCRKASLAAKLAARATPGREELPEAVTIAPEEAHLTDEQWALV